MTPAVNLPIIHARLARRSDPSGRSQEMNGVTRRSRNDRDGLCISIELTPVLLLACCSTVSAQQPGALPTGGNVTAGKGNITQSGADMSVTQQSGRMITDWRSFANMRRARRAQAPPPRLRRGSYRSGRRRSRVPMAEPPVAMTVYPAAARPALRFSVAAEAGAAAG